MASASTWRRSSVAPAPASRPNAPLFAAIAGRPAPARPEAHRRAVGPRAGEAIGSGSFRRGWSEWNGRYRDAVRRFWAGPEHGADEIAAARRRLARPLSRPSARAGGVGQLRHLATTDSRCATWSATSRSTTRPMVRGTRTASDANDSLNFGVEGETDDPAILDLRDRQRRALLATLLLLPRRGHAPRRATSWAARSAATTTPTARTTRSSWLDWTPGDPGRRVPAVRPFADRAAAGPSAPAARRRRRSSARLRWSCSSAPMDAGRGPDAALLLALNPTD